MSKKSKKIFVNTLTASRIVGAFAVPFIFASVSILKLIILLIILFVTDFFDGKLSRRWKVQTIGGSLLDPLGDKLLAISCIFSLISKHKIMIFLFVLEVTIGLLNIMRASSGEVVHTSFIGKTKTWLLSITLVLGAINLFEPNLINMVLGLVGIETEMFLVTEEILSYSIMITLGGEILTLASYFKDALDNKKKNKKKQKYQLKSFKEIIKRLFDEDSFLEDKNKPLIEIVRK